MSLINTKTKTPDAEQALNSAIEAAQDTSPYRSGPDATTWALISIAANLRELVKKSR